MRARLLDHGRCGRPPRAEHEETRVLVVRHRYQGRDVEALGRQRTGACEVDHARQIPDDLLAAHLWPGTQQRPEVLADCALGRAILVLHAHRQHHVDDDDRREQKRAQPEAHEHTGRKRPGRKRTWPESRAARARRAAPRPGPS